MNISKKTSLVILAITSILFSRALFSFFNDPEGPNLLIVTVMSAIVYALSLAAYKYLPVIKQDGAKKLSVLVLVQVIIVTVLYFCLR